MNKLIEISKILNYLPNREWYFNEPVVVSLPHENYFVNGISKGPKGIGVMDGAGNWHGPLLSSSINSIRVIDAIHNKLKSA